MYISGVDYESIADGEGVRCVIYISGCRHNCFGCHNPQTHDFNYGTEVTDAIIDEINLEMDKRPYLSGITLSGGDPMYSASEVLDMLCKLRVPKTNIWTYTGFKYEDIILRAKEHKKHSRSIYLLLNCSSVLVDGKFEIDNKDATLDFRGSSNQRIIDIQKSLNAGEVILWETK